MKMKLTLLTFTFSLLVGSAFGWPWGNVGINVQVPTEQLDVGGNALVRSNLMCNGEIRVSGQQGPWPITNKISASGISISGTVAPTIAWFNQSTSSVLTVELGQVRMSGQNTPLGEQGVFSIKPIRTPVTGIVFSISYITNGTMIRTTWTNVPN